MHHAVSDTPITKAGRNYVKRCLSPKTKASSSIILVDHLIKIAKCWQFKAKMSHLQMHNILCNIA